MRKIAVSAVLSFLLVLTAAQPSQALALAASPSPSASASTSATTSPQTQHTATPRDFSKLAPSGDLDPSAVKAESAILIDSRTGKALFEKDADKQEFPASTTKIMTCLLTLEKCDLSDLVTVDEVPKLEAGATTMDLKQGETLSVEDLLYGLMLVSGNDAAEILAKHISGSIEDFATLMNQKAQELGMTNTHYANPHGLTNPDHYTTARDMATLAMAARRNPEFAKIVSTEKYTIPATNKHDKRVYTNSNLLISTSDKQPYAYQYANGIKTGYTSAAMHALVTSAEKDDLQLVGVVFRDEKYDKWTDSITMFEYGFQFYETVNLSDYVTGLSLSADVQGVSEGDGKLPLTVTPDGPTYITGKRDDIDKIKANPDLLEHTLDLQPNLTAPITKDTEVGTVTFQYDGQDVFTCKLLAAKDVSPGGAATATPGAKAQSNASRTVLRGVLWGLGVLLLLVAAALIVRTINLQRRNRRNRQYNYRYRTTTRRRK